jgi:hypothetical protein
MVSAGIRQALPGDARMASACKRELHALKQAFARVLEHFWLEKLMDIA